MTLSKVPGATLEEIDAAIAEANQLYDRRLEAYHKNHLDCKAQARSFKSETLKELRAYRAIIERKLKQQGGAE